MPRFAEAMPNLHPIVIHVPIVLLTMGLLLDMLSVLRKDSHFELFGRWSQVTGTVGLAVGVLTGLLAKSGVSVSDEGRIFLETHEQIAFGVIALASSLLLWRISNRMLLPSRNRAAYFLLSVVLVGLMWVGAWYGGELVFRFGVGVQLQSP